MAKVSRFDRHFVQRWAERMGGLPDIEQVNAVLAGSLRIIRQEVLYKQCASGCLVRHETLSHYWNHAAGIILLVNDHQGKAITLLTPDMADKYGAQEGPCTAEAQRTQRGPCERQVNTIKAQKG